MFSSMNLTEQKENVEDLKKWWARLADPIAEKMGITSDEFIEMMYKKLSQVTGPSLATMP
jgi:ATP-dependent Clp protease protease subunit